MLDAAKEKSFAFPAINVSSSQTLNAALKGFADAGSDGIIQVSTGGAEYLSGPSVKDMVTGSVAFAAYAAEVAKNYPVNIALHTDHCPKDKLDGFVRPLLDISAERVGPRRGSRCSSRTCGTARPCPSTRTSRSPRSCSPSAPRRNVILEVEIGVVGGEEDGVANEINDQLYTTPEDAIATVKALGAGEQGRYMAALTFGNVHGVYKPGNVKLRPEILKTAQEAVVEKLGLGADAKPFDLVFHGGSGSTAEEIGDAVDFGVVKMNVDTDTQYAFTRPVAGAHVRQLRRRAEGRRRGRQQEAVRPPRLGQGRRGRHGRAHRRGLPEPALRRDVARRLILRERCVTDRRSPGTAQQGVRRPAQAAGPARGRCLLARVRAGGEVARPLEEQHRDEAEQQHGGQQEQRLRHRVAERRRRPARAARRRPPPSDGREGQAVGDQAGVDQDGDRGRPEHGADLARRVVDPGAGPARCRGEVAGGGRGEGRPDERRCPGP